MEKPQRLPDNAIPFTIHGWRVDVLSPEMLLRETARAETLLPGHALPPPMCGFMKR